MKKLLLLLILALNILPCYENGKIKIGNNEIFAQDPTQGEESPINQARCMHQLAEEILQSDFPEPGDKLIKLCNEWRNCTTGELLETDCWQVVKFKDYDPENPISSPPNCTTCTGGGWNGDDGQGGGGDGSSGGTGSGTGTGGGASGGNYTPSTTNYPSSGNLYFQASGFYGGISNSASNKFLLSGQWSLSKTANANSASEILNVNLNFSLTIPATIDAAFLNNPTCKFVLSVFHPGLGVTVEAPQTLNLGSVSAGQTINYSLAHSFTPTNITNVVMYWSNEPVQVSLLGTISYPRSSGSGFGNLLGSQFFYGKVQ